MILTAQDLRGMVRPGPRTLGQLDFSSLAQTGLQIFGTVTSHLNAQRAADQAREDARNMQQQIAASLAAQAAAQQAQAQAQAAQQAARSSGGGLASLLDNPLAILAILGLGFFALKR